MYMNVETNKVLCSNITKTTSLNFCHIIISFDNATVQNASKMQTRPTAADIDEFRMKFKFKMTNALE